MVRWLAPLILLLSFALSASAEVKVAFVNVEKILREAPQAEAVRKRLEREFAPRDKKLLMMQKELKKLEEKLSRDAEVMSESERRKLERKILEKRREFLRAQEEFREDFALRRNEELAKLQKQIFEVIQKLAEEEGIDLLLSGGVVYASERVDVTDQVIERLKEAAK